MMRMANSAKPTYEYSREELDNLSNNIFKKMAQLGATLPELAKMIGMEYQTLWRISYQKDDYVPSLRALFPIANFFHVTVADLLKNPNMPQYIPLLGINDVGDFLISDNTLNSFVGESIFSNEYIHDKAFSINVRSNYLGSAFQTIYICKPCTKITAGNHILVKYETTKHYLVKINSIESNIVLCMDIQSGTNLELNINSIDVLAIAVRQIVDNDLL